MLLKEDKPCRTTGGKWAFGGSALSLVSDIIDGAYMAFESLFCSGGHGHLQESHSAALDADNVHDIG